MLTPFKHLNVTSFLAVADEIFEDGKCFEQEEDVEDNTMSKANDSANLVLFQAVETLLEKVTDLTLSVTESRKLNEHDNGEMVGMYHQDVSSDNYKPICFFFHRKFGERCWPNNIVNGIH